MDVVLVVLVVFLIVFFAVPTYRRRRTVVVNDPPGTAPDFDAWSILYVLAFIVLVVIVLRLLGIV